MLTGESMPVTKVEEDSVVGATINLNGLIEVKVTKREEDSVLASIIKAVEDAQGTKAPIQRMADKIANYFVPIVVGIAVLRSEERRVGKECRTWWGAEKEKEN